MLLFIVAGVASLPSLRRETFPDFTSYQIEVRVVYPGASAEDVEEAVCQRIEDAIDGVKNIKEVVSEAREGLGTVTIEMVESGDFATLFADIKTEVDAIDDFPALAEDPIVTAARARGFGDLRRGDGSDGRDGSQDLLRGPQATAASHGGSFSRRGVRVLRTSDQD